MKLKNWILRIPKPVKVCVCAVCVILLAAVYYIVLGCPATFRQEFRRAEKAHLVGPSKIVDSLKGEYTEFDKMIVGETEEGICFFGKYSYNDGNARKEKTAYYFTYLEKTGDLTLAAAPNVSGVHWSFFGFARTLPVYLFTEDTTAARAEINIHVTGKYRSESNGKAITKAFNETFQAEASRTEEGFFRFWLEGSDKGSLSALYYLSNTTGNAWGFDYSDLPSGATATVRLYDAEGNQIREETITLIAPDEK